MVADKTAQTPPMCLYYNQDLTLIDTLLELSKSKLNERDYLKVMAMNWTSLKGCWIKNLKDLIREDSFVADLLSLENMLVQILLNLERIAARDIQFQEEFMDWALPVQIEENEVEWDKITMILYKLKEETKPKEKINSKNVINVPSGSQEITRAMEFKLSLRNTLKSAVKNEKEGKNMQGKLKISIRKNRFKEMVDIWPKNHRELTNMTEMLKFNFKAQKWKIKRELLFQLENSKLVKGIFDYNNLLINFSMTSPKNKLINKLINKLYKSIKINNNYIMMTSSWSTKKNYAALLRDKNIDPAIYLDYNQVNLNISVWIKNWEIEKIKDFCTMQKRKQWELVSDENNEEINQILEFKQWKNLAKEWYKFYSERKEEKENEMEQDEKQNRINP
jgi:hypothetical protein